MSVRSALSELERVAGDCLRAWGAIADLARQANEARIEVECNALAIRTEIETGMPRQRALEMYRHAADEPKRMRYFRGMG